MYFWNDNFLKITWPLNSPIMTSSKDGLGKSFKEADISD